MRISFVSQATMPPALLLVPKRLPGRLIGLSLGPVIIIEQAFATDQPTVLHELAHCRQFWKNGLVLHFLRYWWSAKYRLNAELEAFSIELAACTQAERKVRLKTSANALSNGYRLSICPDQCEALLDQTTQQLLNGQS
jgi:hypothetical protein